MTPDDLETTCFRLPRQQVALVILLGLGQATTLIAFVLLVWVTADVHYTAAHRYDPARARYRDFHPFWGFVSGPLAAGTFGPNPADDTFGLEVVWQKAPDGRANVPPSEGMQFFGEVLVDGRNGALTVMLKDMSGATLWQTTLEPEGAMPGFG